MSTIKEEHKTIKDVTYFPPGTRRHSFVHQLENVGLPLMLTRTILAPLERWRIIKQTRNSMIAPHVQYGSLLDFISTAPQKQSFLSLWRGNMANCQIYIAQLVSQYLFYENINSFWTWPTTSKLQQFLASMSKVLLASTASNAITFPYEMARIRISMDFYKKRAWQNYKGTLDAINLTRKRQGIFKGVYKGFTLGVVTSALYFSVYGFAAGLFDQIEPEQPIQQNTPANTWFDELKQLTAITCVSGIIYPLDTIKHRLQLNNHGIGMLHNNARHVFQQITKNEGAVALFHGLTTHLVKNALGFFLFRQLIKLKKQNNVHYF